MNLKKGINFGGWLSQCDHTKSHYDSFIMQSDVATVSSWKMDHIRVPFDYNLILDEDGNLIESGFQYFDKIIEWCNDEGLNLILDLHKTPGYDFNNANESKENTLFSDENLKKKFIFLWCEIAKRYGENTNVAFELLNEVVETDFADSWNSLIKRVVQEIRKYARSTTIIYGGIQWNSVSTLKFLEKPLDENILFTFHFYKPMVFTHQNAHWMSVLKTKESVHYPDKMEYYQNLARDFGYDDADNFYPKKDAPVADFIRDRIDEAVAAAKKFAVNLYCGEFGAIDQATAQDSLRWYRDVVAIFDEYNIGHAIWTYKEKDFGIIGNHYKSICSDLVNI